MARFVSLYRNPTVTVRSGTSEVRDAGTGQITRLGTPDLEARFSHDLLDEEAIKLAKLPRSQGGLANLDPTPDGRIPEAPFRGMQQDESGKFLPVETRLSVFDSEVAQLQNHWSDEDTRAVVEALRNSALNGSEFVEIVPAPALQPWRGYDDVPDPGKVIELSGLINADLSAVLQYEQENQNRLEFVEALKIEIESLEEGDVVVTA